MNIEIKHCLAPDGEWDCPFYRRCTDMHDAGCAVWRGRDEPWGELGYEPGRGVRPARCPLVEIGPVTVRTRPEPYDEIAHADWCWGHDHPAPGAAPKCPACRAAYFDGMG